MSERVGDSDHSVVRPYQGVERVLDKWLAFQQYYRELPGLVVAISIGKDLQFSRGYGFSNVSDGTPVTGSTRFRIASISKVFTATALMQLAEKGKLRLRDPVSLYLKETSQKGRFGATSIRELLSHHSGVAREGDTPHWVNYDFPTVDQLRQQLTSRVMIYKTRRRFKYSNFGFGVLGLVVESASGMPYEQFIQGSILERLYMCDTFVDIVPGAEKGLATGYSRRLPGRRRQAFPCIPTNSLSSATGFVSTASDLCKFLSAHMLGNQILLTDASKRFMRRLGYWNKEELAGYGLGLMAWKVNGRYVYGHSGGFPGFISQVALDERNGICAVVLTNSQDGPAKALMGTVFNVVDYFAKERGRSQLVPSMELGRYEGHFTGRWGDLQVLNVGGHLLGFSLSEDKPMTTAFTLVPRGEHLFRMVDLNPYGYDGERARFGFDKKGQLCTMTIGPNPWKIARS